MRDLEIPRLILRYAHLRVLDPARQDRLVASLARYGQSERVLVVPAQSGETEQYVLIDGYKRVSALSTMGRDTVRVTVLEMSEVDALLMTQALARGPKRSAIEDAWLLRELIDEHGLSQRRLAERLGRSTSWISRRLSLIEAVPESVQHAVRTGQMSAAGASKYLAPLHRCNAEHCATLVTALGREAISARDLERIYTAYRDADDDPVVQRRIIENPRLLLRSQNEREQTQAPELSETWDKVLVQDLEKIAAIGWRVERDLTGKGHHRSQLAKRPAVLAAWTRVERVVNALGSVFERVEGTAS